MGFDAVGGVEVHGGGPGLPVLAPGGAVLGPVPFVEAELDVGLPRRSDQFGQCKELSPGELVSTGGDQGGNVEPADKGAAEGVNW